MNLAFDFAFAFGVGGALVAFALALAFALAFALGVGRAKAFGLAVLRSGSGAFPGEVFMFLCSCSSFSCFCFASFVRSALFGISTVCPFLRKEAGFFSSLISSVNFLLMRWGGVSMICVSGKDSLEERLGGFVLVFFEACQACFPVESGLAGRFGLGFFPTQKDLGHLPGCRTALEMNGTTNHSCRTSDCMRTQEQPHTESSRASTHDENCTSAAAQPFLFLLWLLPRPMQHPS